MHCAPGEGFECFSCGAFKEAYHASDSIVVKFCSTDNETKREQALLAAAKEANILELFVPTFFHQLPVTQLDDTNSSRYTYDSHYHTWRQNPDIEAFELNYLEIQPIVVPASHVAYENIAWDEQGEIADRAFQLALMFVQTQAIAEKGRKPSGYEFGKLLEEAEYDYRIEEDKR